MSTGAKAVTLKNTLLLTTGLIGGVLLAQGGLTDLITKAQAQQAGQGQGQGNMGGASDQGAGGAGYGGGTATGGTLLEDRVFRGNGQRITIIIEDSVDEDSDRPDWAMGNRELNPHSQGGGPPVGSGTRKGVLYGDLWEILRDENGEPILDDYNNVQPVLEDGTVVQLTPEGDVPEEYADLLVEVDFGRLNVGRAPPQVTDHALDEALTKLADAATVTVDEAGRLIVDGATIDSPLENLALYIYVMEGGALPVSVVGFDPAALLGAAADKTGKINVDLLVYENSILGINQVTLPSGTTVYYDFSTYEYSRDGYADVLVTYLVDPDGDGVFTPLTESVLEAVFDNESWIDETAGGADDFAQSADDSRAVIEFFHEAMVVPTT